ncbi:hypothetical protein JQN72_08975 [Phycicoccus sp. CSK15P-2]|uniref:hypothetical protein n=1 Tax=Phycicoccus sp. CSK15P-2 TaxID=2807627 RepID=UPI00194E655D|nr:hypothetical protein [Phycicoccus sp. CSK15P-2]MBM6404370.1 hypothetical protein [Phycicoccus sp. CSK15P-2]
MTSTRTLARRCHQAALRLALGAPRRPERGDVPGWVLITLMTALLVAALLTVAQDELVRMFQRAMSTVG